MISIQPATSSHVAQFAAIIDGSWTEDTNTVMKAVVRGDKWLSAAMAGWWESLLENPRAQVVVAVDDETDKVVGWCGWGFRGFEDEEREGLKAWDEVDKAVKLPSRREAVTSTSGKEMPPVPSMTEAELAAGKSRIDAMETMTSADMEAWEERLMPPGCKALYILSITITESAQGLGVGSALAQWGMRRADRAGTWAWMHASEAARFLFEKQKWDVAGELDVDLDEWDPRPEGQRVGKWGRYVFRYFRWPTVEEREGRREKPVVDI